MGDDTTARAMQWHAFRFGNGRNPFPDKPLHVIEPQQRTRKGEAVIGQLRH